MRTVDLSVDLALLAAHFFLPLAHLLLRVRRLPEELHGCAARARVLQGVLMKASSDTVRASFGKMKVAWG